MFWFISQTDCFLNHYASLAVFEGVSFKCFKYFVGGHLETRKGGLEEAGSSGLGQGKLWLVDVSSGKSSKFTTKTFTYNIIPRTNSIFSNFSVQSHEVENCFFYS